MPATPTDTAWANLATLLMVSLGPSLVFHMPHLGAPRPEEGRGRALARGLTMTEPLPTTGRAPEPGFDAR